jgi:hypothetical protein
LLSDDHAGLDPASGSGLTGKIHWITGKARNDDTATRITLQSLIWSLLVF